MYYKPHLLQVRRHYTERDSYGRIVVDEDRWVDVCPCRCDDNNLKEFRNANGQSYIPKYHIVAEGYADVVGGDYIRVIIVDSTENEDANAFAFDLGSQRFGESSTISNLIRGEGTIYNIKHLNYLKYTDIWV